LSLISPLAVLRFISGSPEKNFAFYLKSELMVGIARRTLLITCTTFYGKYCSIQTRRITMHSFNMLY